MFFKKPRYLEPLTEEYPTLESMQTSSVNDTSESSELLQNQQPKLNSDFKWRAITEDIGGQFTTAQCIVQRFNKRFWPDTQLPHSEPEFRYPESQSMSQIEP